MVTQLGSILRRLLGENIVVEIETEANPLLVRADPVMMEMIILNLAVNARDAMPDGGRLMIRAEEIEIQPGESRADGRLLGR